MIVPLTLKSVKLPLVLLTVPAVTVPLAVKLFKPLIVVRFAVDALSVPAATVPLAVRLFKPVRFVMFALVAVIELMFARFVIVFCVPFSEPLKVPPVIVPLTFKSVKLPLVLLTVPAVTVPLAVKLFNPLIVVRFAVDALNVPAATVPLAVTIT